MRMQSWSDESVQSVGQIPRYDAAIIGAGQAGGPLARSLAKAGWRTVLIEKEHVGGTCINEGCTPTKTLIASARVAQVCRRAADYGVDTQQVSVDMAAVTRRKRDIVQSWRDGDERRLRAEKNLDLVFGGASFLDRHVLEVREPGEIPVQMEAERIFVNTGCRPAVPSLPGIESVPFLTSTTAMDLKSVPEHLLVLGGGYVAVEFSQMFRRFGSRVTVVERQSSLVSREDADIAQAVAEILAADGVELVLGANVQAVTQTAEGRIRLDFTAAGSTGSRVGSHLLVATGRVPNTETLDVEAAGLQLDDRGYLPVNERLETRVKGIYALGDANGGPAFTHVSYDDFRIVRTNLLEGGDATTTDRLVPYVIYLDPQLGRVGLTEHEAQERGLDVRVVTLPMNRVARALEIDEAQGFMKAIVDSAEDRIVGCAVLGVEGGEIMSLMQVAMMGGVTASQLKNAVFAHPTLSESLNNLFSR